MRPYLVLCVVALIAVAAFGQQPVPWVYGPCVYGCGPFVPLLTTPMVSFQQVSPNPVGASNATTGLVAGATNSTLSQISGNTSSVYTEPVWYRGGDAPLTTPAVHLWPGPIAREMRALRAEHAPGPRPEAPHAWMYFSGSEYTAGTAQASAAARGGKKAAHSYTNADVERQNENNGNVKYSGKTEKL